MVTGQRTAVLEVSGVQWASEKAVAESVLGRRPGVVSVEANPVAQTATVTYEPARTSVKELSAWLRDCGYHCVGQSVPHHVCDPELEPHDRAEAAPHEAPQRAAHGGHAPMSAHEAMGHGGGHGGMSMDDMVRDMRNRFLVAAVVSVPILLWVELNKQGKSSTDKRRIYSIYNSIRIAMSFFSSAEHNPTTYYPLSHKFSCATRPSRQTAHRANQQYSPIGADLFASFSSLAYNFTRFLVVPLL
jgi:copper chaperone CopZ